MPIVRPHRRRRERLPYALELALAGRGREIENTAANRVVLTEAVYLRMYDNALDEADRLRVSGVLGELLRLRDQRSG